MNNQKLNHYWAKAVNADYWSKIDGIALPVVGLFLFGYLSWHGYRMKLILVMILAVPIALICLIMLIADLYFLTQEKSSSNANKADHES